MRNHHVTKWIITVIVLPLLFFMPKTGLTMAVASNEQYTYAEAASSTVNKDQSKQQPITKEEIIAKTNKFMDLLVQDTGNNYKVTNFKTKEALIKAFDQVASKETAEKFIDMYYDEEDDGLYIIPTETPAWLDENNDFNVIQLQKNQVKVVQHSRSALHGVYSIEIEFTYDDGWRITNVDYS
ncbi:hypothetical protein F3157_03110 [Virgibacillus dakarensis]|nr:hypothetical protein [Virgibacillus dakarensis]MTW84646.1 hypothetical protein [Virgibacillus dakarensis]